MPRKERLDKERVVSAAAELINAEGLDALNLHRLADRLGVQTPSLYNHVDGFAGLRRDLALLSVRSLGDRMANAALGKSGSEAIMAVAQAYRDYIKAAPGLYAASLWVNHATVQEDAELQAAEERVVQVTLAVIASFGIAGEDALHAVRGLRSVVHGFATLEMAGGFGLPLDCDESFRRLMRMLIHGLQQQAGVTRR
jgi:AcrR family transcriptional regulator